jgi:2-polyprenyl-6-methoxyphenol hydroxylase-like FAD-dependent oxidoreductase
MATQQPIVIVGAGPVGCTAALCLAQRGIPVIVIEACETLPLDLRASTFHPPTLDMLAGLGVTEALAAEGLRCPTWQHRDRDRGVIAEWDLGLLSRDTEHPYRIQAEQYKLTRIIAERLSAIGCVDIRFGTRAVGATQDADGVSVELDGGETVAGSYVIAADGASSLIRKAAGIGFPGLTLPELWFVASTPYDFTGDFENLAPIAYVADPELWFVFVRVPGLWRLLAPTRPDETPESVIEETSLQARMQRICPKDGDYEIIHRTAHTVHQRVAETYRRGRILLAGDAAHINNPLGGMGMNGGIHDAVNLAEKLGRIWRNEADDSELDRYQRQRRPVAVEHVQTATLQNKAMLEETDPATRRARQNELRRTAEDPVAAREYLRRTSMITALAHSARLT